MMSSSQRAYRPDAPSFAREERRCDAARQRDADADRRSASAASPPPEPRRSSGRRRPRRRGHRSASFAVFIDVGSSGVRRSRQRIRLHRSFSLNTHVRSTPTECAHETRARRVAAGGLSDEARAKSLHASSRDVRVDRRRPVVVALWRCARRGRVFRVRTVHLIYIVVLGTIICYLNTCCDIC